MNYKQAEQFLYSQLPMFQRVGKAAFKKDLSNTKSLMAHLEHPELKFKSIHIAGTNGKGSVSHILASVLQETGYKVGLYTSPHLTHYTERIKIDGKPVTADWVANFVTKHYEFISELKPSFFEITVAMAFLYFAEKKVDFAVVETGMGGRLDSTNVLNPILTCITNVSLDHTQYLGNTLEAIAGEKAGIIKKNVPVVVGRFDKQYAHIFKQYAQNCATECFFADKNFKLINWNITEDNYTKFTILDKKTKNVFAFTTPLIGNYQKENVLTAWAILNKVTTLKLAIINNSQTKNGYKNVIKNTQLQGRWQILSNNPLTIADTAHNYDALSIVCQQLMQLECQKLHIVFGVVADKDLASILPLFPKKAQYYFCAANLPRALPAIDLAFQAKKHQLKGKVFSSVQLAFSTAKSKAQANDVVFVGGSTFTVAEVLTTIKTNRNNQQQNKYPA